MVTTNDFVISSVKTSGSLLFSIGKAKETKSFAKTHAQNKPQIAPKMPPRIPFIWRNPIVFVIREFNS